MHTRGVSVVKEEQSLKEIHEIREKLSNMDDDERKALFDKVKAKYRDIFVTDHES
jgi:hypothetical protein